VCCPPLSYTPPSPSPMCIELHQDISVDVLMTKENLLVRVLGSYEMVANASVVCTDKTGTLTQNEMTVVAGSVSVHIKFVQNLDENRPRTGEEEKNGPNSRHCAIDMSNLNTTLTWLSSQLAELLNASVSVDSTTFEDVDPKSGAPHIYRKQHRDRFVEICEESRLGELQGNTRCCQHYPGCERDSHPEVHMPCG